MKIFISGNKDPYSYETFCAEEFKRAGCTVRHWNCRPRTPLSPLLKLPFELGRGGAGIYNAERSLAFIRAVKQFRPDVVFFLKSENIHSRAVRVALEASGARFVIWYPDNPFWADQTNMNVLRNLRRCDRFYIWGKFLVDTLHSAGCRSVDYLPFGFFPDFFPVDDARAHPGSNPYRSDLCFVGTWDPERERSLQPLAAFDLAIWGPRWKRHAATDTPLFAKIRGGGLYGADMVRAYHGAGLVFNHLRNHNGDAHNLKTIEIAGIGRPQLVRRTSEQAGELFAQDQHLLCFSDPAECRQRARDMLNAPAAARTQMGRDARTHVFRHHLLRFRIAKILQDLQ